MNVFGCRAPFVGVLPAPDAVAACSSLSDLRRVASGAAIPLRAPMEVDPEQWPTMIAGYVTLVRSRLDAYEDILVFDDVFGELLEREGLPKVTGVDEMRGLAGERGQIRAGQIEFCLIEAFRRLELRGEIVKHSKAGGSGKSKFVDRLAEHCGWTSSGGWEFDRYGTVMPTVLRVASRTIPPETDML